MNANTLERNSIEPAPVTPKSGDGKLHTGPVARLLAQVSKSVGVYAHYRMEHCEERKLAI